jgi:hypothetical protein
MSILDTLYVKRFCLPSNSSIDYKNTLYHKTDCLCGNYNHIACIFLGRGENFISGKKIQILSYGINQYSDVDGTMPSVHAEYDAITNLPPLNNKKNKKNLYNCNIFITRLSKTNKLGSSKPCFQCVNNMYILPESKGYRIKNVYYTDKDENIIKKRLSELLKKDEPYYTRHQRPNRSIMDFLNKIQRT